MKGWLSKHKPWTEDAWNNVVPLAEVLKEKEAELKRMGKSKETLEETIHSTDGAMPRF